jgi:uncharacterized membrane protein
MLPEINPNLHPLVIHFPIAFLTTAVLVDLIALVKRRWTGVRVTAVVIFALGALGALAAFVTGRMAAESVALPTAAATTLTDHEDWALRTLLFFSLYAVVRLVVLRFDLKGARWAQRGAHALLFLAGAGGLFLIVQTGFLGGSLVYEHGVGVGSVDVAELAEADHHEGMQPADSTIVRRLHLMENGSWMWMPGPGAETVLREDFRFVQGAPTDLHVTAAADSAVTLHVAGGPVLMVAGDSLESIQAEAALNVQGFSGTVRLVHHVRGAQQYDFLGIAQGRLQQGRMEGGQARLFDEKPLETQGWVTIRAISDGTHFRGYADGKMVTHGHGAEPAAGPVGLYLEGTGEVQLRHLRVQVLR